MRQVNNDNRPIKSINSWKSLKNQLVKSGWLILIGTLEMTVRCGNLILNSIKFSLFNILFVYTPIFFFFLLYFSSRKRRMPLYRILLTNQKYSFRGTWGKKNDFTNCFVWIDHHSSNINDAITEPKILIKSANRKCYSTSSNQSKFLRFSRKWLPWMSFNFVYSHIDQLYFMLKIHLWKG